MATPPEPAGSQSQHERIYAAARYYDIAFAYRDFAEECDFLIRAAALHLGRDPSSVLELAAGLQSGSEHPLARAVMSAAEQQAVRPAGVEAMKAWMRAARAASSTCSRVAPVRS